MFNKYCICLILALSFPGLAFPETEVTQIGIASPQHEAEIKNIEKLRQRAIRNALDLAVMQVAGSTIDSNRDDTLRSSQKTATVNNETTTKSRTQTRFRSGTTVRSQGHARLMEIVKEWQENGQYFVKIRAGVASNQEVAKTKKCGDYWTQAGKPPIFLSFAENMDGQVRYDQNNRTRSYLRDNFSRNGVMLAKGNQPVGQYEIKTVQTITTDVQADYGTIILHCRLSYQILDSGSSEVLTEDTVAYGPQAGFTEEQAKQDCMRRIAPSGAEGMVRSLGKILVDGLNNGIEYQITIQDMPGNVVNLASEVLQNLYRVTLASPAEYSRNRYTRTIKFKGGAMDLATVIQDAFSDQAWQIVPYQIENRQIRLGWIRP